VKALFVSNQQQQQLTKKFSANNSCHLCVCVCECVGLRKGQHIGNSMWGFISHGRIEIRYEPDTNICKQINNIITDWVVSLQTKR